MYLLMEKQHNRGQDGGAVFLHDVMQQLKARFPSHSAFRVQLDLEPCSSTCPMVIIIFTGHDSLARMRYNMYSQVFPPCTPVRLRPMQHHSKIPIRSLHSAKRIDEHRRDIVMFNRWSTIDDGCVCSCKLWVDILVIFYRH